MNNNDARLQELLDREAIRDCLYRYCRGIDRADEEALRSAYWPDGTDSHGAYSGSATGFVEVALKQLRGGSGRMVHMIGNILIELRGEVAAVESYFLAFQEERDGEGAARETLLCGRYVDRFEKRAGEWRVAARTVTYDWQRQMPLSEALAPAVFGLRQPTGARCPEDPVYALLRQLPPAA
jgi:hypothetical protein